jgi:hypothetical protein
MYPCATLVVAVASNPELIKPLIVNGPARFVLPSHGSFCVPVPFTPSVRYAIQTLMREGSSKSASRSDISQFLSRRLRPRKNRAPPPKHNNANVPGSGIGVTMNSVSKTRVSATNAWRRDTNFTDYHELKSGFSFVSIRVNSCNPCPSHTELGLYRPRLSSQINSRVRVNV